MGRLPDTRNQLVPEVGESATFRRPTYKTRGVPEGMKKRRKKMKGIITNRVCT
jgi:hypothetical protein